MNGKDLSPLCSKNWNYEHSSCGEIKIKFCQDECKENFMRANIWGENSSPLETKHGSSFCPTKTREAEPSTGYLLIRGCGWKSNSKNMCLWVSRMAAFLCLFRHSMNPNVASDRLMETRHHVGLSGPWTLDMIGWSLTAYAGGSELSPQTSWIPRRLIFFKSAILGSEGCVCCMTWVYESLHCPALLVHVLK